jgi:hypothetical protein
MRMKSVLGGGAPNIRGGIPDYPSIEMPNATSTAPEFDSDTTSSQWYMDDSMQKATAERKVAKNKGG